MISTCKGTAWSDDNVRNRIMAPAAKLANESRAAVENLAALPALTPHSLRRTAVSLWEVVGWSTTDSMTALGHAPAKLPMEVYMKPMRLGERERGALRALAEGPSWADRDAWSADEPGRHAPANR